MDVGELASSPIVEVILLLGGLLAMASAVVGHKKETISDDIVVILGFIVGIFIIAVGIIALIFKGNDWPVSTLLILFILGGGLFLHLVKGVKWAALIGLIVGIGVGYGLYILSKSLEITDLLTPTVIAVIAFVIMMMVYITLKFFEDLISIAGGLLSFRPVMFVAGVVGMFEGVLLLLDTSISGILK
jgi:peptidoglycan/LPS O-acetylase OafA/YrhL